jgi:dipeptidyl-peptidase-4
MIYRIVTYFIFSILTLSQTFSQASPKLSLVKIYKEYDLTIKTIGKTFSMADGEHYTILESGHSIFRYDYMTGKEKELFFSDAQLPDTTGYIDDYQFSSDERRLLIATDITRIYRRSFEANYWIYDIQTKSVVPLANGKQQLAVFSPDGQKIAFVKNNNLFYKDLNSGEVVQITNDGAFNRIINGAPDWIYEEEFGFAQAYQWSKDSKNIAFYQFDESLVKQFDMIMYGGLYPHINSFKYPKAGEAISTVNVKVFDLNTGKTVTMYTGQEADQYIPRIKWSAIPGKLGIVTLNRLQNTVNVLLADASTGLSRIIYHEENSKFISKIDDDFIHFTEDQEHFIILSERSGYYHYYRYSITGKLKNPITQGNWEVTNLLAVDENENILYYTSNQTSVLCKDVYSIHLDGTRQKKISTSPGTNEAEFSSTFKYYINTWSNANTPPCYTLHQMNGLLIRVLEDNSELKNKINNYGFARKEFMKIPVDDSLELYGYMIKPADFDSTKQYPLFMCVYGGPQSQDVTDSWDYGMTWQQYMVQQGIIIACIDNRGTDGRGEEFRKSTYLHLGKIETEDQINAAKYLGAKSWIDENHIGIWGWSYGGYMTLNCLTKGADVFKTGIAVAPVTDWRYYGNIYTERYMRKPQDNAKGYEESSPINYAGQMKGNLLLIHGTADDNVHLQNSVEMAEELIKNGIQFQQFMYPDKNHSIYGGTTRHHLYSMMSDFILKNL